MKIWLLFIALLFTLALGTLEKGRTDEKTFNFSRLKLIKDEYRLIKYGQLLSCPEEARGRGFIRLRWYYADRNQDGKTDFWIVDNEIYEKERNYQPYKQIRFWIDDDFDGIYDRLILF